MAVARAFAFAAFLAASFLPPGLAPAVAQTGANSGPIKIGVLNDQSGIYSTSGGQGSVVAAKLAVEDFGGKLLGRPIEIVVGDNLNKPDVGAAMARKWIDEDGVVAIVDGGNSSVGMAIQEVMRQKNRIFLITGSATSDLIGKACSPVGFQWVYDGHELGVSAAKSVLAQGGKSWFFITADYTFGYTLAGAAADTVRAGGGTVVGEVRHPFNTADFSSFILQAQASKAQIVALATGGGDMANAIKSASEFGVVKGGQQLAALLMYIDDVKAVGLDIMQGLIVPDTFYWDHDAKTHQWTERFMARMNGKAPTQIQAGGYSSVLHFLKAAQAAGTTEATAVAAEMRKLPVNDFWSDNVTIRADGHLMRPMYIYRIKKPSQLRYPWDYYEEIGRVSAEDVAIPPEKSECPLFRK
jgi:branched-chain amino acid transport system substrate-binding protein